LLVCFDLRPPEGVRIIDRRDNNVPKDASSTRATILAAAVQTLQGAGVEGFTLDAVAQRAGVVKGLVLYHYTSRGRLLRAAATRIAATRDAALAKALAGGSGMKAVDACWEELRRQAEDGTTKAWLGLCAAGLVDRSTRNLGLEEAAQVAAVDGCAVALASGMPLQDAHDAYNALWLALLDVTEPA
jgi:AcrR family transcriptional regulator